MMTWRVKSGDYRSGYDWQMDWSVRGIRRAIGEPVSIARRRGTPRFRVIIFDDGPARGPSES